MEAVECWYRRNRPNPVLMGWLIEDENGLLKYEPSYVLDQKCEQIIDRWKSMGWV